MEISFYKNKDVNLNGSLKHNWPVLFKTGKLKNLFGPPSLSLCTHSSVVGGGWGLKKEPVRGNIRGVPKLTSEVTDLIQVVIGWGIIRRVRGPLNPGMKAKTGTQDNPSLFLILTPESPGISQQAHVI